MKKFLAGVLVLASLGVAACGGSSHPSSVNQANASSSSVTDASVKSDLANLLNPSGMSPDEVGGNVWQVSLCTHQNGNVYICQAWKNSDTRTLTVTDDGNSISEQGIAQSEVP